MRNKPVAILSGLLAGLLVSAVILTDLTLKKLNSRQVSADEVADRLPHAAADAPLPILWDAPAFSYVDENGRPFGSSDVRGHIWISDFFFTTCTNICPMMTLRMSQLTALINVPSVQFVSFSVDPEDDTPAALKAYATGWKADESRWHFLSTERQKLMDTAAGFKVFVSAPSKDQPIQHSSLFTLVDGDGHVRGIYDSNDIDAIHRLVFDTLHLAGAPAPGGIALTDPAESVDIHAPGAPLYISSGCVACHTQGRVAPSLNGLYGSEVRLDDGRNLTADDAYLRKSLLEPQSLRVAGYPPLMPGYRIQLTDDQVDQMVAYIKSLAGRTAPQLPGQPMDAAHAIDPVCKMEVAAGDNPLNVEFQGKKYYFCSETCRRLFLLAPQKFATPPGK